MALELVTCEAFHAALNADSRDIMPTFGHPWNASTGYRREWRNQKSTARELFGVTDSFNGGQYWLVRPDATEEPKQ